MKPIIKPVSKNIHAIYTREKIQLSSKNHQKIEDYWKKLHNSGKIYFRGEVFTIKKILESDKEIRIELLLTDYAHYIYTLHHPGKPKEFPCRVAYALTLIETKDNYLVFGKMANHTAHPGKYQCVGGGIDFSDISGNKINFEKNIQREIEEEVNIRTNDKNLVRNIQKKYTKEKDSKNSFSIVYKLKLNINRDQFSKHFDCFQKKLKMNGEKSEFEKIIFIHKNSFEKSIKNIEKKSDDYLPILIKFDLFCS